MATMNAYRVTVLAAHESKSSIYSGFFAAPDEQKAAERARFYYCAENARCIVEEVEHACSASPVVEAR
jgi:hypothetical protein